MIFGLLSSEVFVVSEPGYNCCKCRSKGSHLDWTLEPHTDMRTALDWPPTRLHVPEIHIARTEQPCQVGAADFAEAEIALICWVVVGPLDEAF